MRCLEPEGLLRGNQKVMNADCESWLTDFWVTIIFACFSRYFTHRRAWHGQRDPGPVFSGASGQRHGRPPGRFIRHHHRHRQAHRRQRQPSSFHPEWVTQQLEPAAHQRLTLTMQKAGSWCGQCNKTHAVLSVCTHLCSDCCTASNSPALSVYSPCAHNASRSREPSWWGITSLVQSRIKWAVSHR